MNGTFLFPLRPSAGLPPSRRRRRRLRLFFAATLTILAGLAAALYVPPVQRVLFSRTTAWLETRHGLIVRAATVRLDPLALRVSLEGVTIAQRRTPGSPFFTAALVDADAAAGVLSGRPVIERLRLVAPHVDVRAIQADGGGDGRWRGLAPLQVNDLEVENLSLTAGGRDTASVELRGLTLRATGGAPGRLQVTATRPGTLVLGIGDATIPFETIAGRFTLDGSRLTISSVHGGLAAGEVTTSGQLTFDAPAPLALDVAATLDLGRTAAWWNLPPAVTGTARLSGRVTGPFQSPSATVRADAASVAWSALTGARVSAEGTVDSTGIDLAAVELTAPSAHAKGRGRLAWSEMDDPSRLTVDWRTPLLRSLAPLVELEPEDVPRVAATGTADLSWPGFLPGLAGLGGTVRAALASGQHDGLDRGDVLLDGGRARWRVRWRQALPGPTTLQADLQVGLDADRFARSSVGGTLAVESDDVPAALRRLVELDALAPDSVLLALDAGRVDATGTVDGTVAAPRWHADVRAGDVSVAGLAGMTVSGTVAVDTEALDISRLEVRAPGSRLEATGVVRFGEAPGQGAFSGVVDPAWAGTLHVPAEWTITGPVTVTGRWPAEAEGADLAVDLDAEQVALGGRAAGDVNGRITIADQDVAGRFAAPLLGATATGSFTLDDPGSARLRVDLTEADLARLLATGGIADDVLDGVRVRVSGSLEARGDVSDPERVAASARLTHADGNVRGQPVTLSAPAHVTWTDGEAEVSVPAVSVGGARLSVRRTEDPRGPVNQVEGSSPLADLLALLPASIVPAGLTADGTVRLSAAVPAGEPQDLVAQVSVEAADVRRDGRVVARNVRAEARLADGLVDVPSAGATIGSAAVSGSASIPAGWLGPWFATPGGQAAGRLQARIDASLVPMLETLGFEGAELSGSARVRVDLTADEASRDAVRGTIVAEALQVSTSTAAFALAEPARLRVGDGRVTIEQFALSGPRASVRASGYAGLAPDAPVAVRIHGTASMALVDALVAPRVDGDAEADVVVGGTLAHPSFDGHVTLQNISAISPTSRLVFADWGGRLSLRPGLVEILDARGQVNGGTVSLSGTFALGDSPAPAPLVVAAQDVFLEYPPGLRHRVGATLSVTGSREAPHVAGAVTLQAEPYRESAARLAQVVAALAGTTASTTTPEPSWFGSTALDVAVTALGPMRLDNSLGRIDLVPDLRVVGTIDRPALAGTIDAVDGGRIRLQSRTYELTESRLEFVPADGLLPRVFVQGVTQVGEYEVTLRLTGPADAVEASLSSDPPLNERDLQALLVTGQAGDSSIRTSDADRFAVTAMSSDLLGVAGQALGLDSVRIGNESFELVSADVDPAMRLTVSKSFLGRFELVYSDNLDDNTATWIVVYRPHPQIELRASSRDNLEQAVEFRQRIAFGPGGRPQVAANPPRVSAGAGGREIVDGVRVSGVPPADAARLSSLLRMGTGTTFDYSRWMADIERLRRSYFDAGRLTARVVPIRTVAGGVNGAETKVSLEYRVTAGPVTRLIVEGIAADDELLARLRQAWSSTTFDQFADEDLAAAARAVLVTRGHVTATARARVILDSQGDLVATVVIEPGPRADTRTIVPTGMRAIDSREIHAVLQRVGAGIGPWLDSAPLCAAIAEFYASRGYLATRVTSAAPRVDGGRAELPVVIDEGPRATVGAVTFSGADPAREDGLRAAAVLRAHAPFAAGADRAARLAIERHYRNLGFREATVSVTRNGPDAAGRVNLAFTVHEGPLHVVASVRVEGAVSTRRAVIDRAIVLQPGAPAGQQALDATQRGLYQVGTFTSAAVRLEPLPAGTAGPGVRPVEAIVSVAEPKRYQLTYGVELSNEYGPVFDDFIAAAGFSADIRDRNVAGRGLTASLGGRYERNLQAVRSLFAVPPIGPLARAGIRTNLYAGWRVELNEVESGVISEEETVSASIEQRWRPRKWLDVSWGYVYDDRRLALSTPDRELDFRLNGVLASLNAAVVLDRRDSVFDATRGWFHSSSVQQGIRALGSDLAYSRYLARSFWYVPAGPVVLASGVRLGVLWNTTGEAPLSILDQLFNAGGSQTVRGYAQDQLSAAFVGELPIGGTRLLILNQELRFPVMKWVKGVVFADAGNAFSTGAFAWKDLAAGLGFGLRIMTPVAPLRIDLGFPVPRRPGDPLYRWHISIGQMF